MGVMLQQSKSYVYPMVGSLEGFSGMSFSDEPYGTLIVWRSERS